MVASIPLRRLAQPMVFLTCLKRPIFLFAFLWLAAAYGSQDFRTSFHTPCNAIRQGVLLAEIPNAMPCTLCRKNRTEFCESKPLNVCRIYRNDPQFVFPSLRRLAPDARGKDKRSKLPLGLPSIIGGNTVTAITFGVSRERYASKTAQRRHGLFEYQTSQSLIEALLLGLVATILLLILEVSLSSLIGGL